jgi:hypothetical protein
MESLENLKVGDKVFYDSSSTLGISKITRLTKTQIIISNGQRFRKKNGWLVGDNTWAITKIKMLTPKRVETVALLKLKREATLLRDNLIIPKDKENLEKLIVVLKPFVKNKS